MKEINNDEFIKVVDTLDECNFMFGGPIYIITDEDIKLLKSGKIINFSCNYEYGCALIYDNK